MRGSSERAPIVCYVTDRLAIRGHDGQPLREGDRTAALLNKIDAACAAGVDWIQLREKDLSGKEYALLLRSIMKRLEGRTHRPRLIVNDRLDLAIAAGAGGVHLGENSLPVMDVRRWLAERKRTEASASWDFLIGVSCHSIETAQRAAQDGADYIFFGPVFHTPSKESFGPPQGLQRLAEVCRAVKIPVLAIGGVTRENTAPWLAAGASGVAAIRIFQTASDLNPASEESHR